MASLEIRVLGKAQFWRAGEPASGFISNKAEALLVYLAANPGPHGRDHLAGLLWGEMSDANARGNLRQALTNLRVVAGNCLQVERDAAALAGDFSLDAQQFEQRLHQADSLGAEAGAAVMAETLKNYQGDFLEGFYLRDALGFETWMLHERDRLRGQATQALHRLVEFHTRQSNYPQAMQAAMRLLQMEPWREEAHLQMMQLYVRSGQYSAALNQYKTCSKILHKELGVDPSYETTLLYERIRAARTVPRNNLPPAPTVLVGRQGELISLRQRLLDPSCRLVTLTGLGGVGKTRLAQEVARHWKDQFLNGVWYVALAAAEASDLVHTIGNALGYPFSRGDPKKQLLNFLRQKELLLVLDNFEHLLEQAPLVSEILGFAPEVKVLVTSRQRLDLQGEWVVELGGLENPPLGASDLDAFSAAQFFVISAQRAGGNFALNPAEREAVAEICRLVGGLPLGIEIAAAWTHSMDCGEIAGMLRSSLDFLTSTRRDVPERQRSLRVILESTYSRLSAEVQWAFAILAVFRGSFTRAAAVHVCGGDGPLLALLEQSLVQQQDELYELHAMVQMYAAEKLAEDAGWHQTARSRHAEYYVRRLGELSRQDERQTFPEMARELENIRAAWGWAVEQADVAVLAGLAPFLQRFLDLQGRYQEGLALLQAALDGLGVQETADGLSQDERGRLAALLLMYRANITADAGSPRSALADLQGCLTYFQRLDEQSQVTDCLNGLGNACRFLGQEKEAAEYYSQELTIARLLAQGSGDHNQETTALNNLALAIHSMGDFAEAERLHLECLALRRGAEDFAGISSSLVNLSVVYFDQKRTAEARDLLGEAVQISRQLNQTRQLAAALGNLGGCFLKEGQYTEALDYFQQALDIHRNTGYRFGMAIALDNVGTVHFMLERDREALAYLRQSVREASEIHSDMVALDALVSAAGLRARQRDVFGALALLTFIRSHPKVDPETIENVDRLLPQIQRGQPLTVLKEAEERGKMLELGQVIESFLGE